MGRRWSPYTYAFDNPIRFIDPDGMWAQHGDQTDAVRAMQEEEESSKTMKRISAVVNAYLDQQSASQDEATGETSTTENKATGETSKVTTEVGEDGTKGTNTTSNQASGGDNGGRRNMSDQFDKQLQQTKAFFTNAKTQFSFLIPITEDFVKMMYFTSLVKTNAPFDLKNHGYSSTDIGFTSKYHGETFRFDDYGNYNYGVAAKAYGISLDMAIFAAGLNQISKFDADISNPGGWFDHTRDTEMIVKGYNAIIK